MENFHKKSTKITRISYIFFKNIKLLFNGHIYLPHKYNFDRKKKLVFSRFQVGSGAGYGSRSVIPRNGSENPDPYQNETDPKHWLNYLCKKFRLRRTFTNLYLLQISQLPTLDGIGILGQKVEFVFLKRNRLQCAFIHPKYCKVKLISY